MSLKRYLTEMGMGVDVHGKDYTKAATRAVADAIRHSSLNFFQALGKSPNGMQIQAQISITEPSLVDLKRVASELPYGDVAVTAVVGGLDVPASDGADTIVIANAAIIVHFDE